MQRRLQQGSIVWIDALDPRGNRKRRPVMIVTGDTEIASQNMIVGVAGTTSFPEPTPPGYVELPWDSTGRAMAQLRRSSAAVCDWLVGFAADDVQATAGLVPPATLLAILKAMPKSA